MATRREVQQRAEMERDKYITRALPDGRRLRFAADTDPNDIEAAVMAETQFKSARKDDPYTYEQESEMSRVERVYHHLNKTPINIDLDPDYPVPPAEGVSYWNSQFGIDVGAMAGAYYGGEKALKASQGLVNPYLKGGLILAGAAGGAAVGAFGGTFAQHGVLDALNSPIADDQTFRKLALRGMKEGGQAALEELMWGSMFMGGSAVWKSSKFKGKEGLSQLQSALTQNKSTLSLGQAVDDTIAGTVVQGVEGLLRGAALTNGFFKRLNKRQKPLVENSFVGFVDGVVRHATNTLTPSAYGRLVQGIREGGVDIHNEVSHTLFKQLDDYTPTVTVIGDEIDVPTRVSTEQGQFLRNENRGSAQLLKQQLPVDVSGVRKYAKDALEHLRRIGVPETTSEGKGPLTALAAGENRLTFSETHSLLSNIKRIIRSEKLKGDPGIVKMREALEVAESAFEQAGNNLGGDVNTFYKNARQFYKAGKKAFNDDLLVKMLDKDPSKVGKYLSKDATVEDIHRLQRMVRYTSRLPNSKINYRDTWDKIAAGAVTELLPRSPAHSLDGAIFKLPTDADMQDRLSKILGKSRMTVIKDSVEIYKDVLQKAAEKGNLTPRQIEAAHRASLAQVGGTGFSAGTGNLGMLAAFIGIPAIASKIFTSPTMVNSMVAWHKAPPGSAVKRRMGVHLLGMINEASQDEYVRNEMTREERETAYIQEKYGEQQPPEGTGGQSSGDLNMPPAI